MVMIRCSVDMLPEHAVVFDIEFQVFLVFGFKLNKHVRGSKRALMSNIRFKTKLFHFDYCATKFLGKILSKLRVILGGAFPNHIKKKLGVGGRKER